MTIFHSKKGASIILTIFELLVIILVVFMAFSRSKDLGESDRVVRQKAVEELVMMVNTLAALPGDAVVEYPGNMTQYTIILENNQVAVGKTTPEGKISAGESVVKTLILPTGYEAEGIVQNTEKIYLKKENKKMRLTEKPNE